MTYDELAAHLGISRKSAQNLARRKGWKKTLGNDKKARVEVPDDAPQMLPSEDHHEEPQTVPSVDPRIPLLETQIAGLKEIVAAERRRADAAETDRDRWHALAVRPWYRRLVG